jgi:hypothetical protein
MALGGKGALAKPLRKSTKAGEPYTRQPEVESQLNEVLRTSAAEQLGRARTIDKDSPQYLLDECLVYLVLEAALADDSQQYHALAAMLLKRVTRSIERKLQALGVADDDVEDVHQEVVSAMMTSILAGQAGEYYQVRFRSALYRQLLKSYDRYMVHRRRTRREQSLDAPMHNGESANGEDVATFGELLESAEDVAAEVEERLLDAQRGLLVPEALEAISNPNHRKAFVLHHYYEWQVESNDPSVPTLSQLFDRTPRMVRNWLRTAEGQLVEWRAAKGV